MWAKQKRNSFSASRGLAGVQLYRRAGLHHTEQGLGLRRMPSMNVPCFLLLAPDWYPEYNAIWCGKSLCSAGVGCPSCVPSQLLVLPQRSLCWGGVSSSKGPDAVWSLINSSYNIPVLPALLPALYQLLWRKSTLFQPNAAEMIEEGVRHL